MTMAYAVMSFLLGKFFKILFVFDMISKTGPTENLRIALNR